MEQARFHLIIAGTIYFVPVVHLKVSYYRRKIVWTIECLMLWWENYISLMHSLLFILHYCLLNIENQKFRLVSLIYVNMMRSKLFLLHLKVPLASQNLDKTWLTQQHTVPLLKVSITVAVVIWIQTVVLQTTGALPAARQSAAPVRLDLTWTRTSHPPGQRSTLWNTHGYTPPPTNQSTMSFQTCRNMDKRYICGS